MLCEYVRQHATLTPHAIKLDQVVQVYHRKVVPIFRTTPVDDQVVLGYHTLFCQDLLVQCLRKRQGSRVFNSVHNGVGKTGQPSICSKEYERVLGGQSCVPGRAPSRALKVTSSLWRSFTMSLHEPTEYYVIIQCVAYDRRMDADSASRSPRSGFR